MSSAFEDKLLSSSSEEETDFFLKIIQNKFKQKL